MGEETLHASYAITHRVLTVGLLVKRVYRCQTRGATDGIKHVGYRHNREASDDTRLYIYFKGLCSSVLRECCHRVVVPHVDGAFDSNRVGAN